MAIDGAQLVAADTRANRERFPKPRSGPDGEEGYPMVRIVGVLSAETRSVFGASFATDAVGRAGLCN